MSGTALDNLKMDNKPLTPSSAEPLTPEAAMVATSPSPATLPVKGGRRGSPLRDWFIGPDGIYAVPRWLIYLAMAYAIFKIEGWLLLSLPSHLNPLWWDMIAEGTRMLAVILPGFAMAKIESRPFGDFGLPARGAFGRNFWVGTLWGIVSLTVLMLVLRAAGVFTFGSLHLHGGRIVRFALFYAVFFLITAFFEDFFMRGYSQWVLAQGMNFWPAAVLLSFAFGAIHGANPGEAKTGLVAAGLIGFFFCLTLRRTGNLWWAVGFHMAWDWGESYLYSVPDSGTLLSRRLLNSSFHGPDWLTGGSVGPEGSYLVFVVIAALWFVFNRAYPQVKYASIK